ncbi:cysteine dioxygenase type 1 [Biomphalaria pfeifferi]|uniref:cysteine dioxygenase n=1 Tax=Biomphalaria pfeifferi TaxID=112525 RepID=A0AAD8FBY3_BIOPF|nr:cysteine dioxygenase type 1 [Biomphalaria pfeifferi]
MYYSHRVNTITAIEDLTRQLCNFKQPKQTCKVLQLCKLPCKEWLRYAYYHPESKYSRNRIGLEDNRFELFLICWKPGQGNERHGHCGSYCFFQVLHGELCEIIYKPHSEVVSSIEVYKAGQISRGVSLPKSESHEVKNNSSSSWAVSLHIYKKPTATNNVPGKEETIQLEYASIDGKPNDTKCLRLSENREFKTEYARIVNRLECLSSVRVPKKIKVSALRERLFLIAAVTSFVIALVALLLVTLTIKNEQANTVSSKSRFEICLNCSLLVLPTGHPVERKITITYSNDARDKCCAENEQELSTLMELILNASQVLTNEELFSFKKEKLPISAHKRLMQTNVPGQDSNDTHFVLEVDPMYNDPDIEHNSGVDLVPDGLKIIYTGIYYVYSSIEFQNQTVPVSSTKYHYIHRISPGNPSLSGVLLRMVLTVDTSSSPIRETTYTGGAFYLQSGDLIQICLSSSTKINKSPSSFMGLILLSTS